MIVTASLELQQIPQSSPSNLNVTHQIKDIHVLQKATIILSLTFILGGCATGYHSIQNPILGISGGYWDQKGPGNLYKIGFSGNSIIEKEKVTEYILRRCAEVVKREGGNYFILYENLPAAILDHRSTTKTTTTIIGKPTSYAYIFLVDGNEKDSLSAEDILKNKIN